MSFAPSPPYPVPTTHPTARRRPHPTPPPRWHPTTTPLLKPHDGSSPLLRLSGPHTSRARQSLPPLPLLPAAAARSNEALAGGAQVEAGEPARQERQEILIVFEQNGGAPPPPPPGVRTGRSTEWPQATSSIVRAAGAAMTTPVVGASSAPTIKPGQQCLARDDPGTRFQTFVLENFYCPVVRPMCAISTSHVFWITQTNGMLPSSVDLVAKGLNYHFCSHPEAFSVHGDQ